MAFKTDRQRRAAFARLKPKSSRLFYNNVSRVRPFGSVGENDFKLPVRMRVMVPSTKDVNKSLTPQAFKRRVRDTQLWFSERYGGTTTVQATGTYVSDTGKGLVKERVRPVLVYADKDKWEKNIVDLRRWLESKAKKWGQESIGFEFEDDLYFVKPPKKKG